MIMQWKDPALEPAPAGHPAFIQCGEHIYGPAYYSMDPASGRWGWQLEDGRAWDDVTAWDFWPVDREIGATVLSAEDFVGRVVLSDTNAVYIEFSDDEKMVRLVPEQLFLSDLLDIGTVTEPMFVPKLNVYWETEDGGEDQLILNDYGYTWRAWDRDPTKKQRASMEWW